MQTAVIKTIAQETETVRQRHMLQQLTVDIKNKSLKPEMYFGGCFSGLILAHFLSFFLFFSLPPFTLFAAFESKSLYHVGPYV